MTASTDGIWPEVPRPGAGAPNILIVMTDDIGFGACSAFGGPIPTPTFDALAAAGLRYTGFHTTGLCSPSRAALLTGRNPHSVGAGQVPEMANPCDGYSSVIPPSAATIANVLSERGYATAFFGKHHNTPQWESGPDGPFDRWPTGLGFDYFYGFIGGETDQFTPTLFENTLPVEPPIDDPDYILDRDLADRAIGWLRRHRTPVAARPFLLYLAPGTAHAPHQAPQAYLDRFRGAFDSGWDRTRAASFARQMEMGLFPPGARLTPRPDSIPAWDDFGPDEQRLFARMMEAHAAAVAHMDDQVGRVIDELRSADLLDDTLVVFIQGDNGAAGEGGLHGTTNQKNAYGGRRETIAAMIDHIDLIGGPRSFGNYPTGWAWAMNAPFQLTKIFAGHFGGTSNGMVIAWPRRIADRGGIRRQFAYITDLVPTIFELLGITPPAVFRGIAQQPIDGTSLCYSFAAPEAVPARLDQYFESFGNMGYYADGWMISRRPSWLPWGGPPAWPSEPRDDEWELYHIDADPTQSQDLREALPEKVAALSARFRAVAERNRVYPLPVRNARPAPYAYRGLRRLAYGPGDTRLNIARFPDLNGRDWTLTATIRIAPGADDGTIFALGDRFGGFAFGFADDRLCFYYRGDQYDDAVVRLASERLAAAPGLRRVEIAFTRNLPDATSIFGLSLDGRLLDASSVLPLPTLRFPSIGATVAIGRMGSSPIHPALPRSFTGEILSVDLAL